jgi:hypothetical protein
MLPLIVAGPLTTEYVIAPLEAELAETLNGGLPYVLVGTDANVSVGVSAFTVKLVVTVVAA